MTYEEMRELYVAGRRGVLRPVSLVRKAWADGPFRENVLFDMSKSVSKEGDFSLVHWLDTLAGVLSAEEARDLYVQIRDRSRMVEFVWRAEFLAAFPAAEPLLPPIAVDDKLRFAYLDRLARVVDARDGNGVGRVLAEIEGYGIPYAALGRIRPETVADGGVYFEYVYPDDASGITLLEVARQKSTPQIVTQLEEYARRSSAPESPES